MSFFSVMLNFSFLRMQYREDLSHDKIPNHDKQGK
jgi:hypothetical protein